MRDNERRSDDHNMEDNLQDYAYILPFTREPSHQDPEERRPSDKIQHRAKASRTVTLALNLL